jgi:Staphylococcal nuclease homologue/LexA-binding, inner membrane-associated putative hydrolase
MIAVFVGYGSHLFADMMTLGGVQLFWPSRLIAVFPGRDEYRVVSGGNSERVFVALVLVFALLFYPVSRVGFDGLIYPVGSSDQLYGTVTRVTDGDTITVETQGRSTPVRLIGVDTPETVAPDQPIGCFGQRASDYTKQTLTKRIVRLEIPRIGDSEDAYGRTLAYVYLDTNKDGSTASGSFYYLSGTKRWCSRIERPRLPTVGRLPRSRDREDRSRRVNPDADPEEAIGCSLSPSGTQTRSSHSSTAAPRCYVRDAER